MISKRFLHRLRQQDWTGVFIELAIVVFGVFIGLQVDNWNQARQEHHQQRVVEARLLSDFKLLDSQVNQAIDQNDQLIVANHTLIQAMKRGKVLPGEDSQIKLAINRFHGYPTFSHFSSTYTELVSSGKLDLIRNEILRVALARYDENARNGLFNLNSIRRSMDAGFKPTFNAVTLAPLDMRHLHTDMMTGYDISAMAKDEAWRNEVIYNYLLQIWIHSNLISQKHAVDRVLKLIGKHTV